jgi:type IX secretion system PorP/SprF family membrane protein
MRKTFFTILFCAISLAAFAQEQGISSQYQMFPVLLNPGLTGIDNKHEIIANARSSWTGFTGAPSTFNLMYHGPLGDKLALGGGIFADNQGDLNTLRLQGNYAFRFKLQKALIGIGLTTEYLRTQARIGLLSNPLVDGNDDVLENATNGQQIFDATLGIHALYDNRFFVSLAAPNSVRARLDASATSVPEERGRLLQHYVFQLGFILNTPDQSVKIIPSLALRNIRDLPYQLDINVQARFLEEKFIAGLTFRPGSQGMMAFQIGTRLKQQLMLMYSLDVSFGPFQQYNAGSHELTVGYQLPSRKAKTPEVVNN